MSSLSGKFFDLMARVVSGGERMQEQLPYDLVVTRP